MFVNRNAVIITSASKLKFMTAKHILSQTSVNLSKSLNKVINLYVKGVFIIRVLIDMDFEKLVYML